MAWWSFDLEQVFIGLELLSLTMIFCDIPTAQNVGRKWIHGIRINYKSHVMWEPYKCIALSLISIVFREGGIEIIHERYVL